MHALSNECLPFGGAPPIGCATGRLPTAPGMRPAANQRQHGEARNDEPVAHGARLPQHLRAPDHPIGTLMEATIDARDADPVAPTAAPIYLERRRPFVMTANIRGGDDGYRQNLRIGDVHPHITAPPQTFHQGVHHDKSGDDATSDRRLLLAAMFGLATAIVPEAFAGVVVNSQPRFRYIVLAMGLMEIEN